MASIRGLDVPLADIGSVQGDHRTALVTAAERCVRDDGADVFILAGTPRAGQARSLGDELPMPVVDGVSSAVRHAQSMIALRPRSPRSGSIAPPPIKPNQGLPGAIEALLRSVGG